MAYTQDEWIERLRNRSDISRYLYHLTRENGESDCMRVLIKILSERKLVGSTTASGFIVGENKAVCFQDTTTYGLCQNAFHEQKLSLENLNVRYSPVGLGFAKDYIYKKGGRPVIYEKTQIAKEILSKDEWWRIVNFDLTNENKLIDWTHEREWRIKGDLEFDLEDTYVVLVNSDYYKGFIDIIDYDIMKELGGIIVLDPILT
jgi:hypothetical protein